MREERTDGGRRRWALEGPELPGGRMDAAVVAAAGAIAIAVVVTPGPAWAKALAAAGLALLAGLRIRSLRKAHASRGWVAVDELGIDRFDQAGAASVVRWGEAVGLTVLADPRRTRAVLAFTTPAQARYVSVRLRGAEPRVVKALLQHAVIVPEDDLPGGPSPQLLAPAAVELVREVAMRAAGALERIYLSDSRGGGIVLTALELRVGERVFDLTLPLEWRGVHFHEWGANADTLYQGTWVRQGGNEVVLVCPMPAEFPWQRAERVAGHDRLMQALPSAPPPREIRVAVERLFVLPLRRALDGAPSISRAGVPPRSGPHAVQP